MSAPCGKSACGRDLRHKGSASLQRGAIRANLAIVAKTVIFGNLALHE
jgi:hypothetical protein